MGRIDADRERQRLKKLYGAMSDGELESLGRDPHQLTEWAREALGSEMRERGLRWQEAPSGTGAELPGGQEGSEGSEAGAADDAENVAEKQGEPVVLRTYRDISEAMVDRTALESAGIACFLFDDHLIRLDWFVSNAVGGAKLVVSERDATEARRILAELRPLAE